MRDLEALIYDDSFHSTVLSTEEVTALLTGPTVYRLALAMNEHLGPDVLEQLVGDSSPLVRRALAGRDVPPGLEMCLAADSAAPVRFVLAQHRSLSTAAQELLSFDVDRGVRSMLGEREDLVFSLGLGAAFAAERFSEDFTRVVPDGLAETVRALLPGWNGSLGDLLDAARLVQR